MSLVFGPIPSRRLGWSLGINNLPTKICSYSCIYCQLGPTDYISLKRRAFFTPDKVYNEIAKKINQLQKADKPIDYITFVPNGEATIDINLGSTIEKIREFGIKVAVVTNSSLMWVKTVQEDLMKADWVSIKIDSAFENIWEKINRPHNFLKFKRIIQGLEEFAWSFKGILAVETMFVKNINDNLDSMIRTAELIKYINPEKTYLLVPTKSSVERWVKIPDKIQLNEALQVFSNLNINAELFIRTKTIHLPLTSGIKKELLDFSSVRHIPQNVFYFNRF
jgi:wyosine [tRNA(Phe)-imidazoG37] synthetase (radical SAM superfamily)